MKGTSKVIMGVTLTMLLSLAIVLLLVLVLLAELYCSLLLRRRKTTTSAAAAAAKIPKHPQVANHLSSTTLSSLYSQGVLHAPRNFLFPSPQLPPQSAINKNLEDLEMQINSQHSSNNKLGHMFSSTSSPPPTVSPKLAVHDDDIIVTTEEDEYMYICNPVYDLEANNGLCHVAEDTPFETPDSSPSRLGNDDGGGGGELSSSSSAGCSPAASSVTLTPMKELPAKACSVSLKDASSLGTYSRSDSVSNIDGVSSSSSCSPSTSSW